ncbi:MAG TPA: hypothetical protein VJX30_11975 [Terriglobales bacterium]|jgi:hypothetical protein|nr:hypothetical protein [Terriglobales bacterium]
MHRRILGLTLACFSLGQLTLRAQDFKVFDREVQIHGFASQSFVYTNTNNWLTMDSNQGSAAFTDFGLNVSSGITGKLRVGAQVYDYNLGQLGAYHPSLDWAFADYRFKSWLGFRGGKVKTTLGLYNDTQDLDFLYTFALLPQSVYPTDIRDATLAHTGGDVYGSISPMRRLGDFSYTAFVGHRSDGIYGGFAYLASSYGVHFSSYGGLQYGADLRWNTPLKGLLVGISRINEDITAKGTSPNPNPGGAPLPYSSVSKADWINQFYGEYIVGKLRIDSEYRRVLHDESTEGGLLLSTSDTRGCYVSGTYQVMKRLAVGSYYSRYTIHVVSGGPLAPLVPDQTDTSLPGNHVYDKVVTVRVDLNRFWDVKLEGHFMNGYGFGPYPDGFYSQDNPQGFAPNTNALVVKTGFNF